jgi:cilia- and flagella-associated protein 57
MSIASVTPRYAFGIKKDVKDSVWWVDEQNVLFPVGHNVVLYNVETKAQRFIPATEKSEGITAIAVSPNRRYVAVAERAEKALVTIFDLHTLRKRKTLSGGDFQAKVCVARNNCCCADSPQQGTGSSFARGSPDHVTLRPSSLQEYVCVAFSPDSKYILAQGSEPDWILQYWSWEKVRRGVLQFFHIVLLCSPWTSFLLPVTCSMHTVVSL